MASRRFSASFGGTFKLFFGARFVMTDHPLQATFDAAQIMFARIGECIIAWATIENNLAILFRGLAPNGRMADLTWARIRSFDAKLDLLNDVAQEILLDTLRADWNLLKAQTLICYKKRNEIAHSSIIYPGDNVVLIEPFFSFAGPKRRLSVADLERYHLDFNRLMAATSIFLRDTGVASPPPLPQELTGGLLQGLREADAQKREEQRHRALAWRQYFEAHPELKKSKS